MVVLVVVDLDVKSRKFKATSASGGVDGCFTGMIGASTMGVWNHQCFFPLNLLFSFLFLRLGEFGDVCESMLAK
jgi:hypothetical protein